MCTYTRWHYSTLTGLFSLVLVHTNSQDAHYMVSFAEVFNNTDVLLLLTDNLQPDDLLHLRTVNRSCRRLITLDEVRRIRDTEYPQARCRVVVEITEYRSTEVVEAQGGEFVAKLKVTIGTDRSSCCKMANIILPARCREAIYLQMVKKVEEQVVVDKITANVYFGRDIPEVVVLRLFNIFVKTIGIGEEFVQSKGPSRDA